MIWWANNMNIELGEIRKKAAEEENNVSLLLSSDTGTPEMKRVLSTSVALSHHKEIRKTWQQLRKSRAADCARDKEAIIINLKQI